MSCLWWLLQTQHHQQNQLSCLSPVQRCLIYSVSSGNIFPWQPVGGDTEGGRWYLDQMRKDISYTAISYTRCKVARIGTIHMNQLCPCQLEFSHFKCLTKTVMILVLWWWFPFILEVCPNVLCVAFHSILLCDLPPFFLLCSPVCFPPALHLPL